MVRRVIVTTSIIEEKQVLAAKVKECKQGYDGLEELKGTIQWDAKRKQHVCDTTKQQYLAKVVCVFSKTNIRTSPRFSNPFHPVILMPLLLEA